MSERNQDMVTIDLLELWGVIWSHFYVVLIAAAVAALGTWIVTSQVITPQYEATVQMIANTRQDNSTNVTNDQVQSAQNLVNTYSVVIKSNTVLNQVINNLGLDMKYAELEKEVEVTAVENTQVMRITVKDPDRALAKEMLEQIVRVAPGVISETVDAGTCKPITPVTADAKPVSPRIPRDTALAALIGAILASAALVIRHFVQEKHIVSDEDVRQYLELSVLGVIPEIEGGKK